MSVSDEYCAQRLKHISTQRGLFALDLCEVISKINIQKDIQESHDNQYLSQSE